MLFRVLFKLFFNCDEVGARPDGVERGAFHFFKLVQGIVIFCIITDTANFHAA